MPSRDATPPSPSQSPSPPPPPPPPPSLLPRLRVSGAVDRLRKAIESRLVAADAARKAHLDRAVDAFLATDPEHHDVPALLRQARLAVFTPQVAQSIRDDIAAAVQGGWLRDMLSQELRNVHTLDGAPKERDQPVQREVLLNRIIAGAGAQGRRAPPKPSRKADHPDRPAASPPAPHTVLPAVGKGPPAHATPASAEVKRPRARPGLPPLPTSAPAKGVVEHTPDRPPLSKPDGLARAQSPNEGSVASVPDTQVVKGRSTAEHNDPTESISKSPLPSPVPNDHSSSRDSAKPLSPDARAVQKLHEPSRSRSSAIVVTSSETHATADNPSIKRSSFSEAAETLRNLEKTKHPHPHTESDNSDLTLGLVNTQSLSGAKRPQDPTLPKPLSILSPAKTKDSVEESTGAPQESRPFSVQVLKEQHTITLQTVQSGFSERKAPPSVQKTRVAESDTVADTTERTKAQKMEQTGAKGKSSVVNAKIMQASSASVEEVNPLLQKQKEKVQSHDNGIQQNDERCIVNTIEKEKKIAASSDPSPSPIKVLSKDVQTKSSGVNEEKPEQRSGEEGRKEKQAERKSRNMDGFIPKASNALSQKRVLNSSIPKHDVETTPGGNDSADPPSSAKELDRDMTATVGPKNKNGVEIETKTLTHGSTVLTNRNSNLDSSMSAPQDGSAGEILRSAEFPHSPATAAAGDEEGEEAKRKKEKSSDAPLSIKNAHDEEAHRKSEVSHTSPPASENDEGKESASKRENGSSSSSVLNRRDGNKALTKKPSASASDGLSAKSGSKEAGKSRKELPLPSLSQVRDEGKAIKKKKRRGRKPISNKLEEDRSQRKTNYVSRKATGQEDGRAPTDLKERETAQTPTKDPHSQNACEDYQKRKESEGREEVHSEMPRKRKRKHISDNSTFMECTLNSSSPNRGRTVHDSGPRCVPENLEEQKKILCALRELMEQVYAEVFLEPVDPSEKGCAAYYIEIKNPMDLGTIAERLEQATAKSAYYASRRDIFADVELVWSNCRQFNGMFDPIIQDVEKCSAFLASSLERQGIESGVNKENQRRRSRVRSMKRKFEEIQSEERPKKPQQRKKAKPKSDDLNDGRLLDKVVAVFTQRGVKKAKAWARAKVVEFTEHSQSYRLKWLDDGKETSNATFGIDKAFPVFRL